MKTFLSVILAICSAAFTGCQKQEELPATQATNESGATGPAGYLSAAGKAAQSMEKKIDTVSLNQAVELFSAQEGRLPKDLNELVEKKYIAKIPSPPFGTKIVYDAGSGKVSVVKE